MEATATARPQTVPISPNTKLEEILRIFDAQQKNKQHVKNGTRQGAQGQAEKADGYHHQIPQQD